MRSWWWLPTKQQVLQRWKKIFLITFIDISRFRYLLRFRVESKNKVKKKHEININVPPPIQRTSDVVRCVNSGEVSRKALWSIKIYGQRLCTHLHCHFSSVLISSRFICVCVFFVLEHISACRFAASFAHVCGF